LNLPEITLVFDEAIYSKVQMIRWGNETFKKKIVVRLGDFHCVMSYCSAIGKIYQYAGLQVCFMKFQYQSNSLIISYVSLIDDYNIKFSLGNLQYTDR